MNFFVCHTKYVGQACSKEEDFYLFFVLKSSSENQTNVIHFILYKYCLFDMQTLTWVVLGKIDKLWLRTG